MCNIRNSKNTREHIKDERTYCQPSEQLFLKKVATQQLKLNKNNINTRKVKHHRNCDTPCKATNDQCVCTATLVRAMRVRGAAVAL